MTEDIHEAYNICDEIFFKSHDVFSKFGFQDGGILLKYFPESTPEDLFKVVKFFVMNQVKPRVKLYFVHTSHNPVRADGENSLNMFPKFMSADFELYPYTVAVSLEEIDQYLYGDMLDKIHLFIKYKIVGKLTRFFNKGSKS